MGPVDICFEGLKVEKRLRLGGLKTDTMTVKNISLN